MTSRIAAILTLVAISPLVSAAPPNDRELIDAVQRQVKAVMAKTDPAIACVVVSRSTLYPNPPSATDTPGKLGDFDRLKFVQSSTLPASTREAVSNRLDLENRNSIPDNSYGGGVVIDSSGLVLTPYHVIEGATKIYVRLPGVQGSYADILAADARCDLAVLKLQRTPGKLRAVAIADVRTAGVVGQNATIERGSFAVLMSNTYDSALADQPTGSMALIGGVRERPSARATEEAQSRMWNIYHYGTLFQYANQFPAGRQSKLNLPCSGGALFNLDGELIGLTTTVSPLSAGDDSSGYALPMDEHARRAISVLKRGEEIEYGFLGVTSSEHRLGLSILVSPNGPADLARLQDRDVIRQVNGHTIESHKDLFLHVGSALANKHVTIRVQRPGPIELDLVAALGKYEHGLPFIASARPDPVFGLRVDHGSVLLQQLLGNDIATRVPPGVIVRELVPGSPAEAKFKALAEAGGRWVITHVNGTSTTTPAEFYAGAKGKTSVTLSLIDPTSPTPRSRDLSLP